MSAIVEIRFKKGDIIFSIALCLLGLILAIFFIFHSYLPEKIICLVWIILMLIILSERILQLNKAIKGKAALTLSEEGLINYTSVKSVSIAWNKIESFKTGLYRTNSILINVNNPGRYRTTTIKGYFSLIAYLNDVLSSKPYLLRIDIDMLNIKKAELLGVLQKRKLYSVKKTRDSGFTVGD